MLTADLALNADPSYSALTQTYASDLALLEHDFAHSWYRLATRDMGPISRCIGTMTAPEQPWQKPLPPTPATEPDYSAVTADLHDMLTDGSATTEEFARLAFNCASTYRQTDHSGGCNG